MSLIVDALRKAQRGASGRLPPLSLKRPALAMPPGLARAGTPRLLALSGLVVASVTVAVGAAYVLRARPAPPRLVQPVLVVEPVKPAAAPAAPIAEKPANTEAGTSIREVRAALAGDVKPSAAAPSGAPAPRVVASRPSPSPDPRRDVALERVRTALQDAKQASQAAPPSPPVAARASAAVPAPIPVAPPTIAPAAGAAPPVTAPSTVLSIHPEGGKEATALFTSALRWQQLGRLDAAIDDYERSIGADPRNPAAFNNLGVALKDRGRVDEAAEAFQKALALDPKYEKALNNLGVIRFRKGQYEEAISLFKQALLINAGNVESHTNLGLIYLLAGRDDEALNAFQQALVIDPRLVEAHYNLGILWERRGNRDSAQRHYLKFVELAPDRHAALVAKVQERLQFLARGR